MLSINLDRETENYLADIISEENISSEELLKKLIYEHWQSLKPRKTLLQRRGGHPQHLLENAPPDLSLRENRKKVVAEYIQNHHQLGYIAFLIHKRYIADPEQLNQQRFKCAAHMREPL
ncbi:MAG: hypothetical protein GPI97_22310 [Microcystis aeruginosa W13-16]|nr:hypothetical protein [Microcystis aeruginosa W13-16]